MRTAAGRLRLDYSQFLELEMFTRFGGIADTRVRATIARGERIRAALAQPRFATLRLVDQVALLSALSEGVFDKAPVAKVGEARARIAAQLDALAPRGGRGRHGDRRVRRGPAREPHRGGARACQRIRAIMTERLSDVVARIGSVRQLSSVIGAMRGIAAARAREARERVEGVRAYAATVGAAIGQALALAEDGGVPSGSRDGRDGHLVIALCAEQGFAGMFNRRVLDVAERLLKADGSHHRELLLLGGRGLAAAEERGLAVGWSAAMVAHVDEVGALADRVTEAALRAARSRGARRGSASSTPRRRSPRSMSSSARSRPSTSRGSRAPKIRRRRSFRLPPQILLAELAQEYVFAELCEALTLSLAAENEARLRAMTAAKSNVTTMLEELIGRSRRLRQEEMTNEIIELGGRKARER